MAEPSDTLELHNHHDQPNYKQSFEPERDDLDLPTHESNPQADSPMRPQTQAKTSRRSKLATENSSPN